MDASASASGAVSVEKRHRPRATSNNSVVTSAGLYVVARQSRFMGCVMSKGASKRRPSRR